MGILHEAVTRLNEERQGLQNRLQFLNVRSDGREKVVKRLHEVDNEIKYIERYSKTGENGRN
jgi:hypothetical protein